MVTPKSTLNSEQSSLIASSRDAFGGVIVDPEDLGSRVRDFSRRLGHSLANWHAAGVRSVWLQIHVSRANLIPAAIKAGFSFHHADQTGAMLTKKLSDDSRVPPYATHYIGVGGAVIDNNDRLLVVSERFRRSRSGHYYKLPGGALRLGEHIADAAVREVREETGVLAQFEALVCFRHWHGYRYGRSDIYFICRMSPLSQEIRIQAEEIEECLWMPLSEYLQREDVSSFNKRVVAAARRSSGLHTTVVEGYGAPETHEIFVPLDTERVLHNKELP